MPRIALALALFAGLLLPSWSEARRSEGPRLMQATQAPTRDFYVGAWAAHVTEFERRIRIVWTLWEGGRLAYHFADLPDGPLVRGSVGTWRVVGNEMHESWERPDGSRGAGHGNVVRIDDNTLRLIIIDNGYPEYAGLVRIYRRVGVPQLSMRPNRPALTP